MRIGDIILEHGIFLAPMAGVSDLPFRLLCREQGCEMAVTEMVSAKAIWYNRPLRTALEQMSEDGPFPFGDRGTTELLRTVPEDRPLSLQLFGSDPEICGEIAALLELASGFDGDLTVKENTYLRGALLGYTRQFIDEKYNEIIEFAELKEFEDRPFKQLSSGMKSRLAFSIACLVRIRDSAQAAAVSTT